MDEIERLNSIAEHLVVVIGKTDEGVYRRALTANLDLIYQQIEDRKARLNILPSVL